MPHSIPAPQPAPEPENAQPAPQPAPNPAAHGTRSGARSSTRSAAPQLSENRSGTRSGTCSGTALEPRTEHAVIDLSRLSRNPFFGPLATWLKSCQLIMTTSKKQDYGLLACTKGAEHHRAILVVCGYSGRGDHYDASPESLRSSQNVEKPSIHRQGLNVVWAHSSQDLGIGPASCSSLADRDSGSKKVL